MSNPALAATPRRYRALVDPLEPELPDWEPLLALIGDELAGWCVWMGALRLEDGAELHRYRHAVTRRYFHVAKDGRSFSYDWHAAAPGSDAGYVQLTRAAAIRAALVTWPQLGGYERGKHEPLIEAAIARASAGARFWVDPSDLLRRHALDRRLAAEIDGLASAA